MPSAFFNDGTVGRYFRAWIATLDRGRFEVYVYHLRRDVTPFLREMTPHVDHVRTFANALTPSTIAPVVKGDDLAVMVGLTLLHELWVSADPAGYMTHTTDASNLLPGNDFPKKLYLWLPSRAWS